MDIQVATLCDAANDYNGKLCVLGTFDTIGSRSLPVVHQNCVLAMRICFRAVDEGEHDLAIRIIDADGEDVINPLPPVKFDIRLPQEVDFVTRNMIIHFQALQFSKAGTFSLEIAVDDDSLVSIPLRVIYMPQEA
jgi:hypothetical protein